MTKGESIGENPSQTLNKEILVDFKYNNIGLHWNRIITIMKDFGLMRKEIQQKLLQQANQLR